MIQKLNPNRIGMVDALRGFAILAIIVLHHMEHFEFYYAPPYFPDWLKMVDAHILATGYFMFGGKAYAIFALLFGFSFYVQHENQKEKESNFGWRFFWRMILLFVFGVLNTAFYQGDILTLYAFLGLILIPAVYLKTKTVFWISVFLLLQPWEWMRFFYALFHPNFVQSPNLSEGYFAAIAQYMKNGKFWDYIQGNITQGKIASLLWSWENGRFFQAPALFLFGMLTGREQLFSTSEAALHFWKKVHQYAFLCFVILFSIVTFLPHFITRKALLKSLLIIFTSWSNFAFMLILVTLFIHFYQKEKTQKILSKLIPIGKMGLTSYIMQSIIGAVLYYKYGFGLYAYTGATYCLFIGILMFTLQLQFCKWWLKKYPQGGR